MAAFVVDALAAASLQYRPPAAVLAARQHHPRRNVARYLEAKALRQQVPLPRGRKNTLFRVTRWALPFFGRAPPPPPPWWKQMLGATWAHAALAAMGVVVLFLLSASRRRRQRDGGNMNMSTAEMYRRLEMSARAPMPSTKVVAPQIAAVPPPPPRSPLATAPPAEQAASEPATPPPAPATLPPPPAVPIEKPSGTVSPPPPIVPLPSSTTVPPSATSAAPAAQPSGEPSTSGARTTEAKESSQPSSKKNRLSWLMPGDRKKTSVPSLRELLDPGNHDANAPDCAKLMGAVASQLCLDTPKGLFNGVPGVKTVPESIPIATRTALLHAAVKAEADPLKPKLVVESITKVACSMVVEMVDRANALKKREDTIEALDNLVLFVGSAEQLRGELAQDCEGAQIMYKGSLGLRRLEELFEAYLDLSVQEMEQQSASMLSSMMGGGEGFQDIEQMQERADQRERQQQVLAAVLTVSSRKAEKITERRMKAMAEDMQKQMLQNIGNFG